MTFAAPDPVSSGRPYHIIAVDGHDPRGLEQFVGETAFTIGTEGMESTVCGLGTMHPSGVRFYEKDVEHDGKDVRVWEISAGPDDGFTATPTAAF